MRSQIRLALFAAAAFAGISASAQTGKPKPDSDALLGDWRGDSICVVRESACHDEKALYHFKQLGSQPNRFSVQADKIVDGQAVEMGTMECSYAPENHAAVTCSTSKLVLHLTLKGMSLDGTMNLSDGTLWRNISLRHDESSGRLIAP
jgi:hypothetical protein